MADVSPIQFTADDDPGGRDIVAGDPAAAVAAAEARLAEMQADTYGQGSTIGDVLDLPHSPFNPAVGTLDNPPFEGPYFPETNP
jgi:hypothetical protein